MSMRPVVSPPTITPATESRVHRSIAIGACPSTRIDQKQLCSATDVTEYSMYACVGSTQPGSDTEAGPGLQTLVRRQVPGNMDSIGTQDTVNPNYGSHLNLSIS